MRSIAGSRFAAALTLLLAAGLLTSCSDSSDTLFLAAGENSNCDTLRIGIDLTFARDRTPDCRLTEAAELAGCELSVENDDGDFAAIIRDCESRDASALLACKFSEAPSIEAIEAATETVCACDCSDTCAETARICAGSDDSVSCGAAELAGRPARAPLDEKTALRGVAQMSTCSVTFGLTSSQNAGAVQLDIQSTDSTVRFFNINDELQCESLVPGAIASFHRPEKTQLKAGFITASGLQGPAPLFKCRVRADGERDPSSLDVFAISVVDATDPLLNPIDATVEVTDIDCSQPGLEFTRCRTVFSMTSSDLAGSLQIAVESTDASTNFIGSLGDVDCEGLAPSALPAFSSPNKLSVSAGFISTSGIQGPSDLFSCEVIAPGQLEASDFDVFDITVEEATDLNVEPITPTIEQTGTDSCDVLVVTTTSSSTTMDPTTTTLEVTTTTNDGSPTTTNVTGSTQTTQTTTSTTTSTTFEFPFSETVLFSVTASEPLVSLSLTATISALKSADCYTADGATQLESSVIGESLTICLYDADGAPASGQVIIGCYVRTSIEVEISDVTVVRALDRQLQSIEGVTATARLDVE